MSSWRLAGVLTLSGALGLGAAQTDEQDQQEVSVITDPRVVEASGMALSTRDPDLVYVVNDSGNDPVVFSVRVATGDVVGTTTLSGLVPQDTEALAVGPDGQLWVADIGDNSESREEVALLSLPQPSGSGDTTVEPTVYRVRYADGPADAEGLLADPRTGRLAILTKSGFGGQVLQLPVSLSPDEVAVAEPLDVATPGMVTDASMLPDGRGAVLRNYGQAYVYGLPNWTLAGRMALPKTQQGETLTAEPDGRSVLVGSEGSPSPILRVALPADALTKLAPAGEDDGDGDADPAAAPPAQPSRFSESPELVVGSVALAVAVAVLLLLSRRRAG